jgi:hypothetical protein
LDGSVGEHHEDQLLQHHRGKIYNKNNSLPYGNIGADLSRSDAASQYLLPHSPASAHLTRTEYQEPYHALRFSPYYSYSTLLLAGTEGPMKKTNTSAGNDKKTKELGDSEKPKLRHKSKALLFYECSAFLINGPAAV